MQAKTLVFLFLFSKTVFADDEGAPPRNYCALVDECSIGLDETMDDEEPKITDLMEREKSKYPELISGKNEVKNIDDRGTAINGDSQWEGSTGFYRTIKLNYLQVIGFEHEKFNKTAADVLVHGRSAAVWEIEDQERAIAGIEKMTSDFKTVQLPQAKTALTACQENCEPLRKQVEEIEKSLESLETFRLRATHRRHLLANMICKAEEMIAKNLEIESRLSSLDEKPLLTGISKESSVNGTDKRIGIVGRGLAYDAHDRAVAAALETDIRSRELKVLKNMDTSSAFFIPEDAWASTELTKPTEEAEAIYGNFETDLFTRVHRKYQDVERSGALGFMAITP